MGSLPVSYSYQAACLQCHSIESLTWPIPLWKTFQIKGTCFFVRPKFYPCRFECQKGFEPATPGSQIRLTSHRSNQPKKQKKIINCFLSGAYFWLRWPWKPFFLGKRFRLRLLFCSDMQRNRNRLIILIPTFSVFFLPKIFIFTKLVGSYSALFL